MSEPTRPTSQTDLERRLRAVERAIAGDNPFPDLTEDAEVAARLDEMAANLDAVTARVDSLDAAVQAVRGYVGHLDHVNERVERRADAACAAVDRLETELDAALDAEPRADTEPRPALDSIEPVNPDALTESTTPSSSSELDARPSGLLARFRALL